jgi:hypothetical protein
VTRHVSRQLVLALITLLGVAVAHGQGAYPTSESPGQVQFQSAANPANGYGNEVRQPLADSAKTDTRVVCKRVKPTGSSVRRQQCATNAQWRAAREAEIVCRWGRRPGSATREQFCATVAEWRAYEARNGFTPPAGMTPPAVGARGPSAHSAGGTSPSAPGNTNFGGTAGSQASFQH